MTSSGLRITDTKIGTGVTPQAGQVCVMHYTGWLYQDGRKGQKFDSSRDRGKPFEFVIGRRQVIAGWDEGVATMKVGGRGRPSSHPNSATGPEVPLMSFLQMRRSSSMSNCLM